MRLKRSYGNGWIAKGGRVQLSDLGLRVERILAFVYDGIYHIAREARHQRVEWDNEWRIEVVVHQGTFGGLSTYDMDRLTRLLLVAHEERVRVTIEAAAPRYLRLVFHPRKESGRLYERHPSMSDVISKYCEPSEVAA